MMGTVTAMGIARMHIRVRPPPMGSMMIADTGAGEGIRTLDPNLGKVMLYP